MKRFFLLLAIICLMIPHSLLACACGCGVFDVGTASMLPTKPGSMLWMEYDYQNQNRNWSGGSPASADQNDDKKIITNFMTLGYQHMFNRAWGFSAELPYWTRYVKSGDDDGNISKFDHSAIGDIRLRGIYSGFSENMTTGLTFGFKLPSGDYSNPNLDPDTEIGTGSTDLLLGGYHMGEFKNMNWNWFTNTQWDLPIIHAEGYRPGSEVSAAAGTYYDNWKMGKVKIAPLGQVIASYRWRDTGTLALSQASGYERILLAPGLEVDIDRFSIYTDVGFPVLQHVNGDQVVASEFFKFNLSYHF